MAGRYYVATFGCRVNQADSAGIVGELEKSELVRTRDQNEADLIVLNTCTVTHRADTDVRKEVSRIKRENPQARVVVTGCFAQRDPEAVAKLSGVDAVVGNGHKSKLPIVVEQLCQERPVQPIVMHSSMEDDLPPVDPHITVVDRTRPFIKIQDGCDATCTYCIIPSVRGRARSASMQDVLHTVRELVHQGWFEIVLTGVHLGTYREGLAELVRRILEIRGLGRVRMSCIEPMAFPLELAEICAADRRLAPHFHLPLQAGSDRVLKRMVRPYRAEEYIDLIADIRARVPDACIGTDVIVGFPSESEDDFAETMRVVESTVDYVHVFSYSDREGTASTRLLGKIDPRIIKQRSEALHHLGERLWSAYLDRQIGRILPAVVLDDQTALTENYCQVRLQDPPKPHQPCRVHVQQRVGRQLSGALA